jgi:ABC-type nitrate/sulfonate/bicarbonate transport system substrate-binding protein
MAPPGASSGWISHSHGSIVNRRSFLRQLGATGGWLASADLLALCSRARADEVPPALGRIAYQLSWIKNFQFVGEYIADYKGYYQKAGLVVDLLAGGPNVIVDAVVASGKALVGQSAPDFMANAVSKGARLKCIGASYQKNNNCIASMAIAPLRTPQELIGKRIGVQTINLVPWHAFLKLNKIDPASVNLVPVQFDITPLVSGEVDGFFGDINDDVVNVQSRGYDVHCLSFADFGYRMFNGTYSVLVDSLTDKAKRTQLVAFMKCEVLGWQDAVRDPALAARLTTQVYGKGNGLDPKTTLTSCVVSNDFIVSADTQQHGLFWMTPSAVEETIKSLGAAGIKATPDMFSNEILEEVFLGKNALSA